MQLWLWYSAGERVISGNEVIVDIASSHPCFRWCPCALILSQSIVLAKVTDSPLKDGTISMRNGNNQHNDEKAGVTRPRTSTVPEKGTKYTLFSLCWVVVC